MSDATEDTLQQPAKDTQAEIPEVDEEPLQERRERQYILSALWAVVLLGLPIWWSTTTTQRLSLPSAQVRAWQDASVGL